MTNDFHSVQITTGFLELLQFEVEANLIISSLDEDMRKVLAKAMISNVGYSKDTIIKEVSNKFQLFSKKKHRSKIQHLSRKRIRR